MRKIILLVFVCSISVGLQAQKKKSTKSDTSLENLLGNKWILLDSLKQNPRTVTINEEEKQLFLELPKDKLNTYKGFSGCNDFTGQISAGDKGDFKILNMTSTKNICAGNLDKTFENMLYQANKYYINKNILGLYHFEYGKKTEIAFFQKLSSIKVKKEKKDKEKDIQNQKKSLREERSKEITDKKKK